MKIEVGDLVIDLERRSVTRRGKVLDFTPLHLSVLLHLAQNPDRHISKDGLKTVWGQQSVARNTIDQALLGIRATLGEGGPSLIKSAGPGRVIFDRKSYVAWHRKQKREGGDLFGATLATTGLIVIRSITEAWGLKQQLETYDVELTEYDCPWEDSLLDLVQKGQVHIAIYNLRRAKFLLASSPETFSKVCLLRPFGSSMGGKNFYVLARKDSKKWRRNTPWQEFCQQLTDKDFLFAPTDSDMYATFVELLGRFGGCQTAPSPEVIPLARSIEALKSLEAPMFRNAIMMAGTNARVVAEYLDEYIEVVNYHSFDVPGQCLLQQAARNCLIVNSALIEFLGGEDQARQIFRECERQFHESWTDESVTEAIIQRLTTFVSGSRSDDPIAFHYMVRKIVWESYRLGNGDHECLRLKLRQKSASAYSE